MLDKRRVSSIKKLSKAFLKELSYYFGYSPKEVLPHFWAYVDQFSTIIDIDDFEPGKLTYHTLIENLPKGIFIPLIEIMDTSHKHHKYFTKGGTRSYEVVLEALESEDPVHYFLSNMGGK